VKAVSRQSDTQKTVKIHLGDANFILLFVTLRSLGFAHEPSGLICIIPNSRSVALLNNGSEFIFPFINMNFVSIPHVTQKTVKIHLGDVEMKVEPDSGADVNLMDEFHFTNLRKLSGNKLKLEKSKVEISTLQFK
jgi:hypothetical protein